MSEDGGARRVAADVASRAPPSATALVPRLPPPPPAPPPDPAVVAGAAEESRAARRRLGAAMLLPAIAIVALISGAAAWLGALPDVAAVVWYLGLVMAGVPAVWKTLRGALHGHFASDIVAMLAIVTAAVLQQPFAGLIIVLMQTGGEALERYAEGRASASVRALEAAAPRVAHRIRADGHVEDLAADAVEVGDTLLVRPGELVPCDGVVQGGRSHIDRSRLTGEPVPTRAEAGTPVSSGSANGEGPLTLRVTRAARESQYARIVELVRTAQASKAPLQRLADRYAVWFTPATLLVCAITWWLTGDSARVLAVLVIATPCPLILATPIAIIGGINRAAARQIIVRHGGALEQLAGVRAAVFDKTGTLTVGRPEVARVESAGGWTPAALLRLAGAVEQGSSHLLARSTVEAALVGGHAAPLPVATCVSEVAGRGVRGVVEGHAVLLGARRWILETVDGSAPGVAELDTRFAHDTGLRAYVVVDGHVAGVLEYADRLRAEAAAVIVALRRLGIERTVLLSGDHAPNVQAVASALGITEARGDLLPEDKVNAVRAMAARGEPVVMVGDGTNDAPALSGATVGVALAGSAGHGGGITAEAADIVILADELGRLPDAVRISRRTMRIAKQSLAAGLGLSAVGMVFAALGHVPPTIGALLQEAIDVAVILNALRAAGGEPEGSVQRRGFGVAQMGEAAG